ncbi:MAG: DUF2971 domain-containing protein [Alphaproteobacteria bacterium]|nr:DUF2971 domain-containing protein [Alphaproteobacteria bacterium]
MSPLFKFIGNPDDVRFLLNGCLKFTPIPQLNDPSELVPYVVHDAVAESRERLRREGYNDTDMIYLRRQGNLMNLLAPHRMAIPVPPTKERATEQIRNPLYDNTSWLERLLDATAREMADKVGLLCLTKRFDSLPMWAHYANNANGLTVEFQNLDVVFQGDNTGILREARAVRYQRERTGVTFEPDSFESLFFAKFEDWSYEEEFRVVLPLAECRTEQISGDRRLHTYDVPKSCVTRVILGWQMKDEAAQHVRNLALKLNPRVKVVQAHISRGRVEVCG